jgi:hypothetical protein
LRILIELLGHPFELGRQVYQRFLRVQIRAFGCQLQAVPRALMEHFRVHGCPLISGLNAARAEAFRRKTQRTDAGAGALTPVARRAMIGEEPACATKERAREEAMKAAMVVAAIAALLWATPLARAADYPTKPITLVIGFAPGGPSDVMARILTRKMEELLKQPLVIENRAGAGGSIAGAAVARAAPDGYTVLLATGGHVPMAYNPPPPLLPHIQSGAIRAIAITTLKRAAALPVVPTVAELGFPGFEATTWHALIAPAGTPPEVSATLHRAAVAALNDPDVRKALTDLGVDVVANTPKEFRVYLKAEIPKWAAIVKASGAKVD